MCFRGRVKFMVAMAAVVLSATSSGQLSEEQKKQLFLKAREDIRPVPRQETTPRPKPRPAATPRPTPKATPKRSQEPPPSPPRDTGRTTSTEEEDFIPLEGGGTPRPQPATPRPTPDRPAPPPSPTPRTDSDKKPAVPPMDAPIVIEKTGLLEDQGYEPPPKKSLGGGWFKRYRYLTPSVRRAIDQAPVKKGRWRYIIIHNSGTRQGNAKIFDRYHRKTRKMQNGLAYHFVIGNGNASGNGEIEIGSRWTRQINGGHVASDYLNNIAIGICLVGDLNRDKPTAAQLAAIEELVDYLRNRVGKVKGKPAAVRGHKQINPKPTDCPGDRFDLKWLRRRFGW